MSIERWGAFSVVDHKDARKLAADVLLYDRLVLPAPRIRIGSDGSRTNGTRRHLAFIDLGAHLR